MEKNIVFDMDGVLIDTEALILKIWKEVAAKAGIENVEHTLRQCIGITAPETRAVFLRAYGEDFPYEKYVGQASEGFHAYIRKNGLPVKPGVYELFDFLRKTTSGSLWPPPQPRPPCEARWKASGFFHIFM